MTHPSARAASFWLFGRHFQPFAPPDPFHPPIADRPARLAQQAGEAGEAARKTLETPLTQMLDFRRGLADQAAEKMMGGYVGGWARQLVTGQARKSIWRLEIAVTASQAQAVTCWSKANDSGLRGPARRSFMTECMTK